jgi:uncharacterized protein
MWRPIPSPDVVDPVVLYRIQPVRPEMLAEGLTETESKMMAEHWAYVRKLEENGVVILAGRTTNTDSSSFGIVIFNAKSEEEARRIMHEDPSVKNRIVHGDLFPYKIALLNSRNS